MTQKSWDDIDLGGLTMEGSDDESTTAEEQARQERIDVEKLKKVVLDQGDVFPVEIDNPSTSMVTEGEIRDVSPLGIKIAMSGEIAENDIVRLVFKIGKHRMTMRAEVRWTKEGKEKIGHY